MRKSVLICVVSATVAIATSGPVSADGAYTSGKLPFAFPVDTCNETVWIEGWFRETVNFVGDGAGGFHAIIHLDAHGDGLGEDTGLTYRWNDSFEHIVENFTAGGAAEGNWIRRTNLISRGSLENTSFYLTAHYTVNANGDPIVERFEIVSTCN